MAGFMIENCRFRLVACDWIISMRFLEPESEREILPVGRMLPALNQICRWLRELMNLRKVFMSDPETAKLLGASG